MFSTIKAVSFDVGGTLIEPWPSVGHIYAQVAANHGHAGIAPEVLNRQFKEAWKAKRNFRHSRAGWRQLVDATFAGATTAPLSDEMFAELYRTFAEPSAWHIFPDVVPTLEDLGRRGIPLGITSNWDERLGPLLHRLRLSSYFDPIAISVHVGHAKPSQAIFRTVIGAFNLPAEQILHVGDSFEEDVAGACSSGMQALLLERGTEEPQPGSIRSLREILEKI